MHQKVNVLYMYNICPIKVVLETFKFGHSFVFSCLHLFFPKKHFIQKIIIIFLRHGPYLLLPEHLFCLSHHKTCWTMSMDNVGLKMCLLGTSYFMVTLTLYFLGVNRSSHGTSSTTNHKFYMALGQLHGP